MIRPFPSLISLPLNPRKSPGIQRVPRFRFAPHNPRVQLAPSLVSRLSFELYPLNLQLWGAAGMRDTFSRKFARRILKPRGKQDQYRLADGGRTLSSACPFGWLPGRILPSFLPSFLPPSLLCSRGMLCFVDILGNGKEEEGWSILRDVKKRSLHFFFLSPLSGFFPLSLFSPLRPSRI